MYTFAVVGDISTEDELINHRLIESKGTTFFRHILASMVMKMKTIENFENWRFEAVWSDCINTA